MIPRVLLLLNITSIVLALCVLGVCASTGLTGNPLLRSTLPMIVGVLFQVGLIRWCAWRIRLYGRAS